MARYKPRSKNTGLVQGSIRPAIQPILALLIVCSLAASARGETAAGRFFLMGTGYIHIKNMHTGIETSVKLLGPNGEVNDDAFDRIDEVFEFPTREKGEHISPRLIFMLDYFADLVAPGKTINLVSGYRSPGHNASVREAGGNAAKTSAHMDGMALDFYIDGVDGKTLWNIIRRRNCCGVGYYGEATIHLDAARPRFWEASTSKVRTGQSDFNRRIYISADFDRYMSEDTVRLSFSSVSDFGFGIGPAVAIVDDAKGHKKAASARIKSEDNATCLMIEDRKASHFIRLPLPAGLRDGKYRFKIDFCRRPFKQMPQSILSNVIEVRGTRLSSAFTALADDRC